MRDEIARLADKWESEAAGWQSLPKHMKASIGDAQARLACAAELRALERTDHVEDRLGMVREGWQLVPIRATPEMLSQFKRPQFAGLTLGDRYARLLAAAPAPDHSAGVGRAASRKRRVFVDMDGVIVDFDAYKIANNMTGDEVKRAPGAYLAMPAIPGAVEAVRSVIGMGFDVWIATKPPTGVPYAYSDKAAWIMEHLPELKRKIIITHDKGLLGDSRDFLCDDRPHKASCERFAGSLLRFVDGYHWPQALDDLRAALAQPADADAEGGK